MRKSHATIKRHQEDKQSTATSLTTTKTIAKLEWTQSNAQQNIEHFQNITTGVTISNKQTTTKPPPSNGKQPKPLRGLDAFYWHQVFALDSAVVEAQKMFKTSIKADFAEGTSKNLKVQWRSYFYLLWAEDHPGHY